MNRFILLFICFLCTLYGERTQILFHLHDAGETNALLPVIRDFRQAVEETLAMDVSGFFDLMGIPLKSTETCKAAILEALP